MKSKLFQITIIALTAAALGLPAMAAEKSEEALKSQAKVSEKAAAKIALTKVPNGKIKAAELEKENGLLVWSFDIAVPKSQKITEIQVDARTGKVVRQEVETQAQEAAEEHAEKAKKK